MLVGSKTELAFEHMHHASEGIPLGHFRMWAQGTEIGQFGEVVVLGAVVAELQQALSFSGERSFSEFDALRPSAVFRNLHDKLYGDQDLGSAEFNARRYRSTNLSDLGNSSFDDLFVFLVDQHDCQWLMWSDASLDKISVAVLDVEAFDKLAAAYSNLLAEELLGKTL